MKPIAGRLIVVVFPVSGPGHHVPEWGMATGVRGAGGEKLGWQHITIDVRTGRWQSLSWFYPTEAEAQKAATNLRRRLRRLHGKKKRGSP